MTACCPFCYQFVRVIESSLGMMAAHGAPGRPCPGSGLTPDSERKRARQREPTDPWFRPGAGVDTDGHARTEKV